MISAHFIEDNRMTLGKMAKLCKTNEYSFIQRVGKNQNVLKYIANYSRRIFIFEYIQMTSISYEYMGMENRENKMESKKNVVFPLHKTLNRRVEIRFNQEKNERQPNIVKRGSFCYYLMFVNRVPSQMNSSCVDYVFLLVFTFSVMLN